MKKIISIIILIIAFSGIAVLSTKNIYTQQGTITKQNEITTIDGNVWGYTGISYNVGTKIKVTFNNCGTSDITDDIIINIEK